MKTSLKLQEVAEVLAALDLKSSISEAIDVLKDKMVDLEELPLAVVYALPIADGSVLRRETQTFCPSQPFFAIRLGQYCLDISTNWKIGWEKVLEERRKDKDAPMWQLPPLTLLTHLSKRVEEVNTVLEKFGRHPLHRGWYRSKDKNENGETMVFNIITGQAIPESEAKRYDICVRLCYFCEKLIKKKD